MLTKFVMNIKIKYIPLLLFDVICVSNKYFVAKQLRIDRNET